PGYGNNSKSAASQLRECLLCLREAIFKHASFLEFLSSATPVEWRREVDADPECEQRSSDEQLDRDGKEVEAGGEYAEQLAVMPEEGVTLTGAVDSLEDLCRGETRLLYESEGKAELLGEEGVPESLRVWLAESRARTLSEGGYREEACRRLREQVIRFEFLIAKRPVPTDPVLVPRAPSVMMLDLFSRLSEAALARRCRQEVRARRIGR
ncbi:unnamed protein product, partial [Choristocarpus tenellus]